MLLSIFTPTHDPKHLQEAHRSLQRQQNVSWEWVIVPNGPAIGKIPQSVCDDERVRVVPYELEEGEAPKIGALKRFACDNARGKAFVELDHDDMFVPNSLQHVAKQLEQGAGFVYSDAAVFAEAGDQIKPKGYDERYGWETYEIKIFGHDLLATRAFDITPRSLCEIFYAPDHVRCWAREDYYHAGGHNQTMTVGDDHDLLVRTYLKGTKFAHTGGCAYLYREHPGNTVKSHNAEIQQAQAATRDKYFYKLLDEWTRRHGYGYLDMTRQHPQVKFNPDGTLRLKYDTGSIGVIRCFDFLQYTAREHFVETWKEIHRVLRPGGWISCRVPSTTGQGAFAPHHKSEWNEQTFNYITRGDSAFDMGIERPVARFQRFRCWTGFVDKHHRKARISHVFADLCALKGQRQPGRVEI